MCGMPKAGRSAQNAGVSKALPPDVNVEVAGLLLDMSALQTTKPSGLGYKRAAYVVFSLDRPVAEIAAAGTLRDIRGIGPSSERIIEEWVRGERNPGRRAGFEACHMDD